MTATCVCEASDLDERCRKVTACRIPATALPSEYTRFSLDYAQPYQALYATMSAHTLAYSLPNLWAWGEYMGLEMRFAQGFAWMRCMKDDVHILAPVGPWESVDWRILQADLVAAGEICQAPEPLVQLWQQQLTAPMDVTENRNSWEYLYKAEDLAALGGKRYHMQRNHVNAYVREHGEPDLRTLGPDNIPAMLELTARWQEEHTSTESSRAEVASLQRICGQWDALGLITEGLFLDNRLTAFAVGRELDDATMGVFYEKAEPGLRGAFPVMASAFSRLAMERGKSVINRAEDMGEEGIRKSKMLYRPVDFQRMYIVRFPH